MESFWSTNLECFSQWSGSVLEAQKQRHLKDWIKFFLSIKTWMSVFFVLICLVFLYLGLWLLPVFFCLCSPHTKLRVFLSRSEAFNHISLALSPSLVCQGSLFFITSSIKWKNTSSHLRAEVGGIRHRWWNFATLSPSHCSLHSKQW